MNALAPIDAPELPALPTPANVSAPERLSMPLGTAAWHEFNDDARPCFRVGDFWLSRLPTGEAVGFRDDRHVLIASGTRAGKGTSCIIPNLCLWPGSVCVIDPKGENAMVTARRRGGGSPYCEGMGQKVRLLDPFETVQSELDDFSDLRVAFNPLDLMEPHKEESIDDAARIADALIVSENSSDPYWEDAAKTLLKNLILHVASWRDYLPPERNLITVRRLLMEGDAEAKKMIQMNSEDGKAPSGLTLLFAAMQRNHAFSGVVAAAGVMLGDTYKTAPRVMASIIQVACTNTDFMDSPAMRRCLSKSDFTLGELKTDPKGVSLFLSLPQRFMESHYRWLRMMTTLILTEMERIRHQPACGHPILMMLDEFAGLKRMRPIENAAAQIAGFGVKMVFVVQTLAQLKDIYKDNWETLLANASVKLFFGNDDNFSRDYVSKLVGDCEVVRTTGSQSTADGVTTGKSFSDTSGTSSSYTSGSSYTAGSSAGGMSNSSTSSSSSTFSSHQSQTTTDSKGNSHTQTRGLTEGVHKRPLISPDEVGRLFGDRDNPTALGLIAGLQPLRLARAHYYADPAFAGFYDYLSGHPAPPTLIERARTAWEAQRRAAREAEMEMLEDLWAEYARQEAQMRACREANFEAILNDFNEARIVLWYRQKSAHEISLTLALVVSLAAACMSFGQTVALIRNVSLWPLW